MSIYKDVTTKKQLHFIGKKYYVSNLEDPVVCKKCQEPNLFWGKGKDAQPILLDSEGYLHWPLCRSAPVDFLNRLEAMEKRLTEVENTLRDLDSNIFFS